MQIILSSEEEQELIALHKTQKRKRNADRIKTILLLNKGFSQKEVSELLLLDENSVGTYKTNYLNRSDKTSWFQDNYKPYVGKLSYTSIGYIFKYIDNFQVSTKAEVQNYIAQSFAVNYKASGLQRLFTRVGLSFKQMHRLPGKVDIVKQTEFIEKFEKSTAELTAKETLVFIDAVHPLHNSTCSKTWSRIGQIRWINSNTGRERLNINGAYNPFNQDFIYRNDKTIDAQSTIKLLEQISAHYSYLDTVYVYADNARTNKNKELTEWLKSQDRIKMRYLPPYSPNLNLIERLWKFMRKNILNTKYYAEFNSFQEAITSFFDNLDQYKDKIAQFIGLKFQTFKPT